MRKKLISVLLCAAMTVAMLAGCGNGGGQTPDPTPTTAAEPTNAPTAEPTKEPTPEPTKAPVGEALPEAKYYFSLDGVSDGLVAKKNVNDATLTTMAERVYDVDKQFYFTNGVKNQCLWLNGDFGAQVSTVEALNSDTYTISFWMWANRISNYGTVCQFGSGMAQSTTEHWLSFTTLDATTTFPTLWNRDAATAVWPFPAYKDATIYGVKEWAHIVLVCDETDLADYNGSLTLNAKLYVNGVPSENVINIVPGCFTDEGEFAFLLGVNPWDAIYKGAIDELYIFDQALTEGQVATLFADGDASKDPENPVSEEGRDHTDVVTKGYIFGSKDCTTAAGTVYTDTKLVPIGGTAELKFANYTKGETFEDTFALILQNVANAHNVTDNAAYKEHAVISGAKPNNVALESYLVRNTFNQFNPKTYGDNTDRANYTVTITNHGTTVDVLMTAVCADNVTRYLEYAGIPVDGEVYACLTTAGGFIDYLPDIMIKGTQLGNIDFTSGWWSAHSEPVQVPAGETVTTRLINYTGGAQNYQNWVAVLQNVPAVHNNTDNPAYKEYAVVRSDAYGWCGLLNTNANLAELGWTIETDFDFATPEGQEAFRNLMKEATVDVAVTNHGTSADVIATITSTTGEVHYMKYFNIPVDGDLYYCFTADGTCLDILGSYSGVEVIGEMDCSTVFWTDFTNPVAVPVGETVTTHFINHTIGQANYQNFVVILQNVATGHSAADNPLYSEYGVARADNAGWLYGTNSWTDLAGLGWTLECDWDWTTFLNDMKEADVVVAVTNHGTTAEIVASVTTTEGKVYTQRYANILVNGDLFFCLTVEGGWLDILK